MPPGTGVRPTSDRVREALFGRLGDLKGARILDLFAGSGALGIEALSRGASEAVFVERSGAVAAVLRSNLDALGLTGSGRLVRAEAAAGVRRLAQQGEPFDLALLDPPYQDAAALQQALRALASSGILAPRATVMVEASKHAPPILVEGLARVDERRYGDTVLHRFEPVERK